MIFRATIAAGVLALILAVPDGRVRAEEPAAGPLQVVVERFEFTGATAFSTNALAEAVAFYTGRPVGEAELLAAAQAITTLYLSHGYWNSRAVLPDQEIVNGIVALLVVEGRLDEIYLHGTRRLRPGWIERRIRADTPTPLKMEDLAAGLQELRGNPNIEFITADLQPLKVDGKAVPGGSVLDVRVQEIPPWRVALQVDNQRPPSVGEYELLLNLADVNLTGHSDVLEFDYGILQQKPGGGVEFSGDSNLGVAYTIPVTPRDLRVGAFYDRRNYAVVQPPFNELDLESSYWNAGLRLAQPVYQRLGEQLTVGLVFEYRHSQSTLLGEPFPITPDSVNGEVNVTALRFTGDWSRSWGDQVLSVQLVGSLGLDALEATILPEGRDSQFFSLLGRTQYGIRLWNTGEGGPASSGQLILRGGFQWTPDNLPAMEQLSFGGVTSVRGYPVNYAVRDQGVLASAELRLTLLDHRQVTITGGPFVDFGAGWNVDSTTPDPPTLSSVGISLQALFWQQLSVRVDWGHGFNRTLFTENEPDYHGVNFVVSWQIL